nr:hypothetical protein [Tanacetum cinerariifolium]
EITSLKRRVKKLEEKQRSGTHKHKRLYNVCLIARVDSSKDEPNLGEDASKQGKKIDDIDADEDITLFNAQDDAKMFDINNLHGERCLLIKMMLIKRFTWLLYKNPLTLGFEAFNFASAFAKVTSLVVIVAAVLSVVAMLAALS